MPMSEDVKPGEMRFNDDHALERFGVILRHWARLRDNGDDCPEGTMSKSAFIAALAAPSDGKAPLVHGEDYRLDAGIKRVSVEHFGLDSLRVGIPAYGRMTPGSGYEGTSFRIPVFYDQTGSRRNGAQVVFSNDEADAAERFLNMRIADYSVAQCA